MSLVSTSIHSPALAPFIEECAGIPEAKVLAPRVDLPSAVLTVLGASPEIERHREKLVARFGPSVDRSIARLVPLARAAQAAHAEHLAGHAKDLEGPFRELGDERARLVSDVEALVLRGFLDKRALSGLIGGQAYKDRTTDLGILVGRLRASWPAIEGHTKLTLAELDRVERLAEDFSRDYAEREQATAGQTATGDLRARTFTLLSSAYDHVRKCVGFVRWHEGDADQIAPSLYAGRTRSSSEVPGAPVAPATPVRPGMPGADPFDPNAR